eukprot:741063-Rhodomonas_salina.1
MPKRSSAPVIPNLVREAYVCGSSHKAETPELVRSHLKNDGVTVDFQWQAYGTRVYTVNVRGAVKVSWSDARGARDEAVYGGLQVQCSCPNAKIQAKDSSKIKKLIVCKHAYAALESVLDLHATAKMSKVVNREKQQQEQEQEIMADESRSEALAQMVTQQKQQGRAPLVYLVIHDKEPQDSGSDYNYSSCLHSRQDSEVLYVCSTQKRAEMLAKAYVEANLFEKDGYLGEQDDVECVDWMLEGWFRRNFSDCSAGDDR